MISPFSRYVCIVSYFCVLSSVASPRIELLFSAYPDSADSTSEARKQSGKLARPSKLAQYQLKKLAQHQKLSGISCIYAGYVRTTNQEGFVSFPRKHTQPRAYLLITERITPIVMFANTIHHWEFDTTAPHAFYFCKHQESKEAQTPFWNITPHAKPGNNRIPDETIIIIAHPKSIYVPEGATITNGGANLVLPPLYVKKGVQRIDSSLFMLDINYLMRGPFEEHKSLPKSVDGAFGE